MLPQLMHPKATDYVSDSHHTVMSDCLNLVILPLFHYLNIIEVINKLVYITRHTAERKDRWAE